MEVLDYADGIGFPGRCFGSCRRCGDVFLNPPIQVQGTATPSLTFEILLEKIVIPKARARAGVSEI
jgi:hypothetical protein